MTTEPTCAAQVFEALKYNIEVDDDGTRWYYNNEGQLHCTDGPAIEYWNGTKYWYQNGLRHRTDGPAIECTNGDKFWYLYGVRHRTDGPAIEWHAGVCEWYLEGVRYAESEYHTALICLGIKQ